VLYFFDGYRTEVNDFTMAKCFQKYTNILPVIAKADTFKPDELLKMKLDIITTAHDRGLIFFDCAQTLSELFDKDKESFLKASR